jgi:hypothetical protein
MADHPTKIWMQCWSDKPVKYVVEVITSTKTRPISPLEWEKRLVDELRKSLDILKNMALRIFQIHE